MLSGCDHAFHGVVLVPPPNGVRVACGIVAFRSEHWTDEDLRALRNILLLKSIANYRRRAPLTSRIDNYIKFSSFERSIKDGMLRTAT
jgi:hypothetical protein